MNITKVDVDMNSLFNLTYSFEHLKLMLESMLNNQNAMVDKINELENRFNESDAKNDDLRRSITEKQTLYEKKIRSVETYLKKNSRNNNGKGGAYVVSDVTNSSNEGKGMNDGSIGEDSSKANVNVNDSVNANANGSNDVNAVNNNDTANNMDNNVRDNKDKKDIDQQQRNGARVDGIDGDGSNYEDEEADFFSQAVNGGIDVSEFEALKQRVNDLEKKTKNMNLLKFGSS